METRAYRLQMHSALHVGEQGIGNEKTLAYIPSDTLFSALVVTWSTLADLQGDLPALVDPAGAPPLLLTSAFPYAGAVRLLPRPALPLVPALPKGETAKTLKKVRWVSEAVFSVLIAGVDQKSLDKLWHGPATPQDGAELICEHADAAARIPWTGAETLQAGAVWVDKCEAKQLKQELPTNERDEHLIWWSDAMPRVAVDRITSASQIYHVGRTFFAKNCGLWFAARGEAKWLDSMERVLAVKEADGIGGLRSVGNGQFTLHKDKAPAFLTPKIDSAQNSSRYALLLSRMAPAEAQMALLRIEWANYHLTLVGGFNGTPGVNPVVRRQVRLLTEGSLIGAPAADGGPPGQLVDVTPESTPWLGHRIYRNGYGFTVPVYEPAGGWS